MTRVSCILALAALVCGFEWGEQGTSLAEVLEHGTPAEKRAAVESLSHVPRSNPAWRVALTVNDPETLAIALRHFARVAEDEDAPLLAPLASHPQPEVRAATLASWQRISPTGSESLLIRALSDPDARVRAQAAQSLSGRSSDEVVRALERGLDDPDERVRTAAVDALGPTGSGKKNHNELRLRALRKAAGDPEPKLRAAALRALAQGAGSTGMIYQGVSDRDPNVRAAAVAVLGATPDPAAIELLATILDQDDEANARLALEALLYHEQSKATDALLARNEAIIRHGLVDEAASALPHLSPKAQARWREKLAHALAEGISPVAHTRLLVALGEPTPFDVSSAESTLLELANRPGDAQLDALRLLGSCKSDRALVSLVRAIGSEDAAMRTVALAGLADFQELNPKDARIADGLLEALQTAPSSVRPEIIRRVGATGARHLAPRLLPLLDLHHSDLLLATLKALAKMPHAQSSQKLRKLLAHSNAKIRRAAAIALGASGVQDDRQWLQEQLDGDHPWDRAALLIALRSIVERLGSDDDTLGTLERYLFGERESLAALAAASLSYHARTQDMEVLRSLLQHPSHARRALAASHLAAVEDKATTQALRERLLDEKERMTVRIAAATTLATRGQLPPGAQQMPWAVHRALNCASAFQSTPRKSVDKKSSKAERRHFVAMAAGSNVPLRAQTRALHFSDGRSLWVVTDALGEVHLWNVPEGPVQLIDPLASPPACSAK